MTKLIKYTHDASTNEISCELTYTLQGRVVDLRAKFNAEDLQTITLTNICTKLTQIMGLTVTV